MLTEDVQQVESDSKVNLPSKPGTSPEQTSALEESLFKISGQLSTITRNQKYFRTRENRNFSTVRSTESRIVNFSLVQIALVICMGALQVFVVRFFFQVCLGYDALLHPTAHTFKTIRARGRVTYKRIHLPARHDLAGRIVKKLALWSLHGWEAYHRDGL